MAAAAVLSFTRKENVCMAKLATQAERYKDVVEIMEKVAAEYGNLTIDERNLLFDAYKNVVCDCLTPFRIISSMEQECSGNEFDVSTIRAYRSKLKSEISLFYKRIFLLLDSKLNLPDSAGESNVFYLKMKADFLCYLAHYSTGADREKAAEKALSAYKSAQDVAITELSPINPIRLSLVLNFSVFYYAILRSRDRACELAKQAYDEGHEVISKLDELETEANIYSVAILRLMECDLYLWTLEEPVDEDFEIKLMEVP